MAPGQLTYTEKLRPSSVTSPYVPASTCHVHPPSHLPLVGSALKLHGHPQSQLHATRTCPVRCHRSAIGECRCEAGCVDGGSARSLVVSKTLRGATAIRNGAAMTERDAGVGPEVIPRRDQILIATCILLIGALAWAYLMYLNSQASSARASQTAMEGMRMPRDMAGGVAGVLLTFTMWSVMMVGMMAPSATPMLLLFATSQARRGARGAPTLTLLFGVGYLTI